jgi:hypothetical protein
MRALRFLRHNPCAALLGAQLAGIVVYPFMEDTEAGRPLLALFGLVVLALTLRAVHATPALLWVAMTLAVPAVGLLLVQLVTGDEQILVWAAGFEAGLYFYAAWAMLRYMYADHEVTTDELFAIGAVFTLVAWGFAYTYVVLQALQPGSFTAEANPLADRTWAELLYLSVTTLSGTGLSDVAPVRGHARSVGMLEQIAGVFYIAMVVTRLVGIRAAKAAAEEAGESRPA